MKVSVFGDTIIGKKRDHNEDSFLIRCDINNQWQEINDNQLEIKDSKGLIFAVADGMGGTNAGEVASAIAIKTLKESIETIYKKTDKPDYIQKTLNSIVHTIHNNIRKEAKKKNETKGMGTTLVLGWILNNNLYLIWVGDSRCYHYNKSRNSQLTPFSDDHSLVWSRVKNGEITAEEARLSSESNLLLQSLGDTYQTPKPDFRWIKLSDNDRILLCSDGLNSMLSAIGIQQILDFSNSTKETCQSLINSANNAGGNDNITAILIDIIETDQNNNQSIIKPLSNKRRFGFIVSFLALLIVVAGAYFADRKLNYLTNIKKVLSKITLTKPQNPEDDSDPVLVQSRNDTISILDSKVMDVSHSTDTEHESAMNKTYESNAKTDRIQGNEIQSLQYVLDQIKRIELKIEPIQPNKSEYQPEFYSSHKKSIESLQHALDSLKHNIITFAEVKDNKIIRLKDISIKGINISSILMTIDSLNTVTENILSSQK